MELRPFRAENAGRWAAALVLVGLGLRVYHYARNPSVWHDEAALAMNVLTKGFGDFQGPLLYSEAAPPLFLWAEKAISLLLGPGTYSLRLVPFLAGCAALLGLVTAGRRILGTGPALAWLALMAACSDRLLWHGCEAKPYAVDVALAAGLLGAAVATDRWQPRKQILFFTALTPFLLFLSYPACFLLGGGGLWLFTRVVREPRGSRPWPMFAGFLVVLGLAFVALWAGPAAAQRDEVILHEWQDVFPQWERPWSVPCWAAFRAVEVGRYALEPTGGALTLAAVVGVVTLWQTGRRRLAGMLLAPTLLAGLAGLLGFYPFGATRVMAFAAPSVLLLMAAGLPVMFSWLRRHGALGVPVLAAVVLFPAAQAAYRVLAPWPRADSAAAAELVHRCRRPGEWVVGTVWDHDYYFRDLGRAYQLALPARPVRVGPTGPRRIWLIAAGKTPERQAALLATLAPRGTWRVVGTYSFRRTTVYCLASVG